MCNSQRVWRIIRVETTVRCFWSIDEKSEHFYFIVNLEDGSVRKCEFFVESTAECRQYFGENPFPEKFYRQSNFTFTVSIKKYFTFPSVVISLQPGIYIYNFVKFKDTEFTMFAHSSRN